ncbi:hypothetical protein [Phycicoccus sp. Root101]|uniref:hypothetical protein n=1 Tax=Phycicoccus sp. Root101 TaxID=1736421 RepID=UPI000AA03302|nr:hypothetical protein [Phycicoccus sp. Root101]
MHWRERNISRSMVALVASLSALALLGLWTQLPGWLGRDAGVSDVSPGLLRVAPGAKGVATLGGGVTVSLYPDGMRIVRGQSLLTQTVIGGSMISAVEGRATGTGADTDEHVTRRLSNLSIDELVFLPGRATYFGTVSDGALSMPVVIRIELAGSVIRVGASVNGADGIVWHLDHRPLTTGLRPALTARNLRGTAAWISPGSVEGQGAFSTNLGTDVGVGPGRVARGVDVRADGRIDVHIWSDAGFLTISSYARPQPAPSG